MTAEHEGRQELRRQFPDRRIALEHFDFTVDDIRLDQRIDRLDTGREDRPLNGLFERLGNILAFLLGVNDRVANSRNVPQLFLNLPHGTSDAGGCLIVGPSRQDAHEFLKHVDGAVGQMAGKVQYRRGQHGMPAFGVEIA